ncbi:GNAT family N-acetyltransferase [Marmoricola sp. RAF53]|uniref:GNAT family N-acetyltransferase n=1 Tax=Marmoricola sp. RAF53 TaxID=3233059 RepID=UPI003F9447A4
MPGPVVEFRESPVDTGDGAVLLVGYAAEIAATYDGVDVNAPDMPKAGPDELGPPHGVFLIGYGTEGAVCCGGIKRLPDGACEIKRMYVVPGARRQGLARLLLHALEDAARERGYAVARMDTGPRHQHAIALYESEGYAPVPNFNGNPVATWFGEKRL